MRYGCEATVLETAELTDLRAVEMASYIVSESVELYGRDDGYGPDDGMIRLIALYAVL